MSEMLEKVAKALCGAYGWDPEHPSSDDYRAARAALLALREPTKDMMPKGLEAIQMNMDYGRDTDGSYEMPDHGTAYHCFVAMIDAILSETQEIAE